MNGKKINSNLQAMTEINYFTTSNIETDTLQT